MSTFHHTLVQRYEFSVKLPNKNEKKYQNSRKLWLDPEKELSGISILQI
jgi:hypothetical protein